MAICRAGAMIGASCPMATTSCTSSSFRSFSSCAPSRVASRPAPRLDAPDVPKRERARRSDKPVRQHPGFFEPGSRRIAVGRGMGVAIIWLRVGSKTVDTRVDLQADHHMGRVLIYDSGVNPTESSADGAAARLAASLRWQRFCPWARRPRHHEVAGPLLFVLASRACARARRAGGPSPDR